jgi:hypothetical protein
MTLNPADALAKKPSFHLSLASFNILVLQLREKCSRERENVARIAFYIAAL